MYVTLESRLVLAKEVPKCANLVVAPLRKGADYVACLLNKHEFSAVLCTNDSTEGVLLPERRACYHFEDGVRYNSLGQIENEVLNCGKGYAIPPRSHSRARVQGMDIVTTAVPRQYGETKRVESTPDTSNNAVPNLYSTLQSPIARYPRPGVFFLS